MPELESLPNHHEHDEHTSELERLRSRVHNINDCVQDHDRLIAVLTSQAERDRIDLQAIRNSAVTTAVLAHAIENMNLKIDALRTTLEPIAKAVYWAAGIIIAGVVAGFITLLFKG